MKCNQFEEGEIPYGALEKFGLSHEMIEDLPMHVLEDIWNGRQSPVLPIHVTDDEGELIKSRTRFSLVRMEDGKVDVMFYPVLKYALLEQPTAAAQRWQSCGGRCDITSRNHHQSLCAN